jgi:hypothetical protein
MLSCAGANRCYAVSDPPIARFASAPDYLMNLGSGDLDVSSDGGSSWSAIPLPTGVVLTTALSCQSAEDCVAGALQLGSPQALAAVAPSASASVVSALLGSSTSGSADADCANGLLDGGLTESDTLAVLEDFRDVATAANADALDGNTCAAGLTRVIGSTLGGLYSGVGEGIAPSPWSGEFPTGAALSSVESDFAAMSLYRTASTTAVVESTTNGGVSWTPISLPSGTGPLISLSCPSMSTCTGLDWTKTVIGPLDTLPWQNAYPVAQFEPVSLIATSDDGASWTTTSFPTEADVPYSISCTSVADCLAVGVIGAGSGFTAHQGLVLQSTDGGQTWTTASLPPNVTQVIQVSCPSTAECFAIGREQLATPTSAVLSSSDGGATWTLLSNPTAPNGPTGPLSLSSISCPTTTTCAVSGGLPTAQTGRGTNGLGAADESVTGPGGYVYSPTSGPNSGPAMVASTDDDGATWTVTTFGWQEANGNELLWTTQVECSTPTSCLATGGSSSFSASVLVGPA